MSLLSFRVRLARLGGDSPGPNRVGPDGLDHGRQTIAQRGPDGAIPRQNTLKFESCAITGFSMANRSLLELSCRLFLSLFFVGLPLGIDSKRGVLLLLPVFGIFSFFFYY
ncbi:hypothetical protein C8Q69DRAFT_224396 [Paecilomyces variotii]|uniref:Uncharacterized protein n=1 Tax=Byssochlamys spectabilis TaxID=264951 RepID=A0A443HVU2_BYSSP|nr:hypothetical protein C8Q69DRAFT_224396 [Paecilomyces variotii]RWQ95948.1 hypothetical protein C8Q69DRAFT_224396 [Paecilomyces variotii]